MTNLTNAPKTLPALPGARPAFGGPFHPQGDYLVVGVNPVTGREQQMASLSGVCAVANQRRIVACLNACEGLSTAALETVAEGRNLLQLLPRHTPLMTVDAAAHGLLRRACYAVYNAWDDEPDKYTARALVAEALAALEGKAVPGSLPQLRDMALRELDLVTDRILSAEEKEARRAARV